MAKDLSETRDFAASSIPKDIQHVIHGPSGNRNGGMTPEKAYNGTHARAYYRTPVEFFSSLTYLKDSADTAKGTVLRRCLLYYKFVKSYIILNTKTTLTFHMWQMLTNP